MRRKHIEIILWFAGFGFFLNFFWEILHGIFLYMPHWGGTEAYVPLILRASLGDAMYLLIVFFIGALLWRSIQWVSPMTLSKYLYVISIGIVLAVSIEVRAVYFFHQWEYSDLMPTILGIGISPLVQLATTGLIAALLVRRIIGDAPVRSRKPARCAR